MASLGKGYTFSATEEVTAAKLHTLIDSGSISGIVAADISDGVITDAKMSSVGGNKFTNLNIIPSGAGVIPAANLTSVAQKGANSDITSLSGLTTVLSRAQGGLASNVANNAANGVVVLNASSQLPAVSGALLTSLPITTTYAAGNYMVCRATATQTTDSTSYVKLKEIKIGGSGTIRVIFNIRSSGTPHDTAYGKIYRNAGSVGTEQSNGDTSYETFTEDISGWVTGDLLQLYIKTGTSASPAYTSILGLGVATPDKESGVLVGYE